MGRVLKNIFNVIKISFILCFLCAFIMFCLNKLVLKVDIRFTYYLMIGALSFMAMSVILMFIQRKKIFAKKAKVRKAVKSDDEKAKPAMKKEVKKEAKKEQKHIRRKRRKVS